MDARDLGSAILNAASLFQDLNRKLHPDSPAINVTVRALSQGSFGIDLRLVYQQLQGVLYSPDVAQAADELSKLVQIGVGLLQLAGMLNPRRVPESDGGM